MMWQLPVLVKSSRSACDGVVSGVGWLWIVPAMRIFGSMYRWSTADTSEEVVPGKNITSTMVLSSARSNPANSAGAVDLQTSRMKRSVSFDISFIFTGLFMHETVFIPSYCCDQQNPGSFIERLSIKFCGERSSMEQDEILWIS